MGFKFANIQTILKKRMHVIIGLLCVAGLLLLLNTYVMEGFNIPTLYAKAGTTTTQTTGTGTTTTQTTGTGTTGTGTTGTGTTGTGTTGTGTTATK